LLGVQGRCRDDQQRRQARSMESSHLKSVHLAAIPRADWNFLIPPARIERLDPSPETQIVGKRRKVVKGERLFAEDPWNAKPPIGLAAGRDRWPHFNLQPYH
jgi:hypothetical protein